MMCFYQRSLWSFQDKSRPACKCEERGARQGERERDPGRAGTWCDAGRTSRPRSRPSSARLSQTSWNRPWSALEFNFCCKTCLNNILMFPLYVPSKNVILFWVCHPFLPFFGQLTANSKSSSASTQRKWWQPVSKHAIRIDSIDF